MDPGLLAVFGTLGAIIAALLVIAAVVVGGGALVRALKLPVDLPHALRFLPPPPPVRPPGDRATARAIAERQHRLVAIHVHARAAAEAAGRATDIEALSVGTATAAVTAACAERARAAASVADTARSLPEAEAKAEVDRQVAAANAALVEAETALGPVYRRTAHLWVLAIVLVLLLVLLWVVHPRLAAPLNATSIHDDAEVPTAPAAPAAPHAHP